MGREFKVGDEPVPGYRLVAMLGKGGFGTVWQAAGPGRTEVALKSTDLLDSKRGMREFKSLRLMKRVRHPNLVPIVAIWLIDANGVPLDDDSIDLLGSNLIDSATRAATGTALATQHFNAARAERLIVAMGLGDKDLFDLLKEYQANGEPAVPVDKLLDYMEEAAKAIDFLNEPRHDMSEPGAAPQLKSIHHCDIKPGNIMLVGGAVQVCDFGLARREDVRATSVALSVAYGAPELYWENKPTQGTDQYSLAITYYELRCGELPFAQDLSQLEVMQLHRDGKLDFCRVSEAERAVLKRATSPKPPERYPTCRDMVGALRRAVLGSSDILRYAVDGGQARVDSGMRSTLVQGREIVPGYRLGEHLFHADTRTDVWSSSGPGGKHFSLWIYELTSLSETVDLSALRSIQQHVNHPHLARLSGWWCLNAAGEDVTAAFAEKGETDAGACKLVIASEPARNTLAHKAQEGRELSGEGLPAEDLLDYVRQVSGAIDALNAAVYGANYASLMHTDVRPDNVLLVGNSAKLANLAWCRTLVGNEAVMAGFDSRAPRMTWAPELTEGRLHRRSDQFSLAVSYVQLRSGKLMVESALPSATTQFFAGPELDLSALTSEERSVLDRALSRDPSQRYPSCQALVEALSQVVVKRRVPEMVPAQRSTDGPYRGTVDMPQAPIPPDTDTERHRKTRNTFRSTTNPDVLRPPVASRRSKAKLFSAAAMFTVLAAGGILLTPPGRGLYEKVVARLPASPEHDDKPGGSDEPNLDEPGGTQNGGLNPGETITTGGGAPPIVRVEKPEALVGRWLNQANRDLDDGALDDANENLIKADEKIDAELLARSDLRRQSDVLHAYLAWQQKAWSDADNWLKQVSADKFTASEARSRTQFYLLRALVTARYDGSALDDGADLEAISSALADLQRDALWQQRADDLLASPIKDLIEELGGRLAAMLASNDAGQRSRGEQISAHLDLTSLPEVQRLLAVNKTMALLQSPAPWAAVQKSLEPWKTDRDLLPPEMVGRLVMSLADWGRKSNDAGLDHAVAEIDRFTLTTAELRREFAGLLIEQLARKASEAQPDWKQLRKMCRRADEAVSQADGHPRRYFVTACEAECQLETASSGPLAGKIGELLKAQVAPADRGYVDYVVLRGWQSHKRIVDEQNSAVLADRLCGTLSSPPPVLAVALRRSRAGELLIESARGLLAEDGSDDPLALPTYGSAERAEQAHRWLTRAQQLVDARANKPAEEFVLELAVASAEMRGADPAQVSALLDGLLKQPAPPPKALLMAARWLERSQHPAEAVRRYADALQAVVKLGTAGNEAIYDRIVAPGIRVVEAMNKSQLAPVATEAASLYANKGRLIRLDTAVNLKVFEESQITGADAVFSAYDKAIGLDASVADYYIRRGTARYSTSNHNDLTELKRDDIERARALLGGQETPGFLSLTGVARLLEGRAAQHDRTVRVDFYKQAVDDQRQAVEHCDPQNEDYPQFLLLHSYACLELANFTTEPDETIRGYLSDAVHSAERAIADGRGAHPEFTYWALGNAHEDYGLLVRDYEGYRKAMRDFDDARLKALDTLSPPEEAQIALGRARYRLATCGAESATSVDELLTQGLADLQAAIDAQRAPPTRLAEAYSWQAQIYTARMQRASGRASAAAARKDASVLAAETAKFNAARAAANTAMAECVRRVEQGGPDWCNYQLYWAGLGATPDEMRSRARAVLDVPNSKADGAQRAQSLTLVANSYISAKSTAEQRRGQLRRALDEYQHYLPWLPDVSKAQVQHTAALLALTELLYSDRDLWREKRDLCKASGERALALAAELQSADLAARAHEALAAHAVQAANQTTTIDLASLRQAADQLKAAVEFDDKLPTSGLLAQERQSVRKYFAGRWRQALALTHGKIAADPRTPPANAKRYCAEGLAALANAKDLPASFKQGFQDERLKLLRIQQQLQQLQPKQ